LGSSHGIQEDVVSFIDCYPSFHLEDELLITGGEMSCGAAGDRLHAAKTVSQGVPAAIRVWGID
jgi:hypothetical protein